MKRARCFSLAMLVVAESIAAAPAFAQAPLGAPAYGGPGPYMAADGTPVVQPYGSPAPMVGVDWADTIDDPVFPDGNYGQQVLFEGSFLRAEYLNWNINNPGNALLGAPVAGVANPTVPFQVVDPGTNNVTALTRIPTTRPIGTNDIDGLRVTMGLEMLYGGSIEVGAFMLSRKQSGFVIGPDQLNQLAFVTNPGDPLSGHLVPMTVGTSLLQSGQISNTVLQYNQSYQAIYHSQLWGAEANWIGDYDRVGLFWANPILGVRYFNLHERLTQTGVFQDTVILSPPITSTIESVTYNNLYGPQAGGRVEFISRYIHMGIESKLMFLTNTMSGNVATDNLRSISDPRTNNSDTTTKFSFGVDVGTYGSINVTDNLSIRVGYNFYWFGKVTRPEDNVFYNSNGLAAPPGVDIRMKSNDLIIHGASFGGELRF